VRIELAERLVEIVIGGHCGTGEQVSCIYIQLMATRKRGK